MTDNGVIFRDFSVNVSSLSRFHAFDLASQLENHRVLKTLFTAYPKYKLTQSAYANNVKSFPWFYTPAAYLNRIGWASIFDQAGYFLATTFDRWVSLNLSSANVFHCLSGFGLLSHQIAKVKFGSLTVCDRGSSHIQYQNDLLVEEYLKWGVDKKPVDPRIIERELEEYNYCDVIIVPSEFARKSFIDKGIPEKKLYKVPYGVDLSLFSPKQKTDDTFRVLFVGTLSIRKGVVYLLEAIRRLNNPKIEVWLIGGMTDEIVPLLEKYRHYFKYLGFIPRIELAKYMSECSVLVLPSIEDGLSLVMAQAMACGLPVIATTNTGAEDLFEDGVDGFIIPIADPDALVEKIEFFIDDPSRLKVMGKTGKERVHRLKGWDNYGNQMMAIYSRFYPGHEDH